MMITNWRNWYWKVSGNPGVYSSAINSYVTEADLAYTAWLGAGGHTSQIGSEAEIWPYVQPHLAAWLFDGVTFSQPAVGAYMPAQLTAYAASLRYAKETGGITVAGVPVATDRASQGMIDRAYSMATRDPSFTTRWKGASGGFGAVLDAPTIIAVATAVGAHVAGCFAREAVVADAIASGTLKTPADIDAAFDAA